MEQNMSIYDIRVNRFRGYAIVEGLQFISWKIKSSQRGVKQEACRIRLTRKGGGLIWDSGRLEDGEAVQVPYAGPPLDPFGEYHMEIDVWDNHGNTASGSSEFETALPSGKEMAGKWITYGDIFQGKGLRRGACYYFQKRIEAGKPVRRARLYITAKGIYSLELNGRMVGNQYLSPGWTNYHKRIQYQVYDIPVKQGENLLTVIGAEGWYKGYIGFACDTDVYGDKIEVIAQLRIWYEDGTWEDIGTDESWTVTNGAHVSGDLFMGEEIDFTAAPGAPEQARAGAAQDKSMLLLQESEPVREVLRIPAAACFVTPAGEHVIDFGQNISGVAELSVKGREGQRITLEYGETLDENGNFFRRNLADAKAMDTFVCDGRENVFLPLFTSHGFRYIRVSGLQEIRREDFVACVRHSVLTPLGEFKCSLEKVNRLQDNIRWSQRDNFVDIPTDCPQRSERLGWTGDAAVFSPAAAFNFDCAQFFGKWLHDLKSEQFEDGGVPYVVPNVMGSSANASGWSDSAVLIPWAVYEAYGDREILREQYESMKAWVGYITAHCGENGLWQTGYQYGDWLALDKEESEDRTGFTDKYFIANAYYINDLDIMARASEVLGKTAEAEGYRMRRREVLESFRQEYMTPAGRMVTETQCALALALRFRLCEDRFRDRISGLLAANIAGHKNHLCTGFIGTPHLCHALSESGRHALAGTIFLKEDYPSWLYAVNMGATTIWERWNAVLPDGSINPDGMNSLNHYAYGAIGEWMYRKLGGIRPEEAGYRRIVFEPMPVKGITWADTSFESSYGRIRCSWKCENHKMTVDLEVPPNTTARAVLPEHEEMELESGIYHLEYETGLSLERDRYSMDTRLGDVMGLPEAVEFLQGAAPEIAGNPMLRYIYDRTLEEVAIQGGDGLRRVWEMLLKKLNQAEKRNI